MALTHNNSTVTTRSKEALYRGATALAAFAFVALGAADLMRAPAIMDGLVHLGYPVYLATMLGVWKLLGAAAITAPGLPTLKEWAYAGMFFDLTGAAMSHVASGGPIGNIMPPLVLLGFVMISRALLPAHEAVPASVEPLRQTA